MSAIRGPGSRCTWRYARLNCLRSTSMNDRPAGSTIARGQSAFGGLVRDDTPVSSLTLSTELRDTIVEHLWRCLPHEGVAVLATTRLGSALTAVRFYPGRNMDRSPRRYTMEPADVLAALADMK